MFEVYSNVQELRRKDFIFFEIMACLNCVQNVWNGSSKVPFVLKAFFKREFATFF